MVFYELFIESIFGVKSKKGHMTHLSLKTKNP